jgi:tetratricopeptide (TPR) repeat protein
MSSLRTLLEEINQLEDAGRYQAALLLLARFPAQLQRRADVLRRQGKLLQRLSRYDEAVEAFRQAGTDGKSIEALRACVEEHVAFLEGIGCHEKAASLHDVILSQAPDDVQKLINQGISFGMADNYERALQCFDQATTIAPNDERAWYNKGIALLDTGQIDRALECFEQTITINRSSGPAWYQKAVCLMRQSQLVTMPWSRSSKLQEARQCLGKALRIDPKLDDARQLLESFEG